MDNLLNIALLVSALAMLVSLVVSVGYGMAVSKQRRAKEALEEELRRHDALR